MPLIGGHTVGKLEYLIQKYFIKLPQVVDKYILYDLICKMNSKRSIV